MSLPSLPVPGAGVRQVVVARGPSALAAVTTMTVLILIGVPLVAIPLGLRSVLPTAVLAPVVLVGLLLSLAGALAFVVAVGPARRREARAGYTTLPGGSTAVPQIDERTGVVLRPAGAPTLGYGRTLELRRARASLSDAAPAAAGPVAAGPSRIRAILLVAVLGAVLLGGFAYGLRNVLDPSASISSLWHSWLLVVGVPVLLVAVAVLLLGDRRRLAGVRDRRPGALVVTSRATAALRSASPALRRLGGSFAITVVDEGIELWRSGRDAAPTVVVPHAAMTGVGVGAVDGAVQVGMSARRIATPVLRIALDPRAGLGSEIPLTVDARAGGPAAVRDELLRRRARAGR